MTLYSFTHEASPAQANAGSLLEFLSQRQLLIAANRAPVIFQRNAAGEVEQSRGSGGLVTALAGLARHVEASWVACARTPEDALWSSGEVTLAPGDARMQVSFLNPDPEAYDGYYNQIANPLLWFLQHSMWNLPRLPVIDRRTWQAWDHGYAKINQMFADEIARLVQHSRQPALVMLHDYHLYLAPRGIRQQLPRGQRPTLLHFTHIPWPGPEYWLILPPTMRRAILDGLCAADLLGFQTSTDAANFVRTVEAFLPKAHANLRRQRIWYRNHATHVRDFPISIDVAQLKSLAASPEVAAYAEEIRTLSAGQKLILRIDRIEPSKNIVRGFLAYEQLLELHPEVRGKVVFLAILVPSRLGLEEYTDYLDHIHATAGRVNAAYGSRDWEPVRLLVAENYPRAVAALQQYDVLLVNAIADGMNLVAKEGPVVNENDGVLILSERAGAQQQLGPGATTISPCDVYATAEAMNQALHMDPQERQTRAQRLRWIIERSDLDNWLYSQLAEAQKLSL